MPKIDPYDTIVAIATPIGEGGIGIVRLSGSEALSIADRIFVSKDGKKPSDYGTYTTHYGHIINSPQSTVHSPQKRDEKSWTVDRGPSTDIIDEVILTVMRSPKTYTKEDVVEINCHGGIVPLKKVLDLVLSIGARLAEPGEFTKRAFLNGRIDLVQAEAVLDIVKAKTEKALDVALAQLSGDLSKSIAALRGKLIDIKVHLEASIDFPEEGLSVYSRPKLTNALNSVKSDLENFINSFESGRIIREGINCVICGKPNVGKSSLMNELLNEERVIVTPVPGTTRDAICECINIEGIPVNIVDTAGIAQTKDPVEKEGIIRSRLWINKADLVLFMLDSAADFTEEDKQIIEAIRHKEVICIVNKIDLGSGRIDRQAVRGHFGKDISFVEISILKRLNLDVLLRTVTDKIWKGGVSASDYNILTNARHKNSFLEALKFVNEALSSLNAPQPEDIIAISVASAISSLGEVTGDEISQEVLDRIFGQFCIGK